MTRGRRCTTVDGEEDEDAPPEETDGAYKCPVCPKEYGKGNQLYSHYMAEHAITDAMVQTYPVHTCRL